MPVDIKSVVGMPLSMIVRLIVILLPALFSLSQAQAGYIAPNDFKQDRHSLKALVFLSHRCPCSKSHIEHLNKLQKQYPELQIFGVISEPTYGEEKKLSDQYFSSEAFSFPIIDDPKQELVSEYKALKTPHTTLFKKTSSGQYQIIYQGGVTSQRSFAQSSRLFLAENLQSLKTEGNVKYKQGRSLGCYIRRI